MIVKIVCCLFFVLSNTFFAQQSKEDKLQQLKSRSDIKVTEVEKDLLKLEYPNSKEIYKNIADYQSPESGTQNLVYSPTYDSTIIDLTTIDTTLYYNKYKFWQEVPLTNFDFNHLMIGDVNNNGKTELYGSRKFYETPTEPICIYELDNSDQFKFKYQYDSAYLSQNIYDIDKDGNNEVQVLGYMGEQRFFSKENDTSFATQLNFILDYERTQLDDQILGDFDGDQKTDLLFDRHSPPDVYIFEYNPVINNFDSVYYFHIQDSIELGIGGYSVKDFDLDGKTDIVFSTIMGKVFVIENEGDNQYENIWQGSVASYNAYYHTNTNDIDQNGKPEFWIMANSYYNGIGITRITIFETSGDNNYQQVGRVDLIGVFSFYAGTMQAVDIDNDGVEEVAICIDGNFLILKFSGSADKHKYQLIYLKRPDIDTAQEWQTYFGSIMYDILNNAEKYILISMAHSKEEFNTIYSKAETKIYRPDSTTFSTNENYYIPVSSLLYQNYPSPFNPSTSIKFILNGFEKISIKIYNMLGKEIKTLFDQYLPFGEHTVQWDGKDDERNLLPGGVYFIQMIAGSYRKTIKTIFLK